jgi:hypothetical protein
MSERGRVVRVHIKSERKLLIKWECALSSSHLRVSSPPVTTMSVVDLVEIMRVGFCHRR